MRRPTDTSQRSAAVERLAQLGAAAMPDVRDTLEPHLASVRTERMQPSRPARGAAAPGRRHVLVATAIMAFVAMPSLAIAGVLPDPVQRAASRIAGSVGVAIPAPDRARDSDRSSGGRDGEAPTAPAGDAVDGTQPRTSNPQLDQQLSDGPGSDTGRDARPADVDPPGRPEGDEQRGNRFGQVEAGPDQGKAAQAGGTPGQPATSGRPASTPKPPPQSKPAPETKPAAEPKPATPTPATPSTATPAPAAGASDGSGRPDKR